MQFSQGQIGVGVVAGAAVRSHPMDLSSPPRPCRLLPELCVCRDPLRSRLMAAALAGAAAVTALRRSGYGHCCCSPSPSTPSPPAPGFSTRGGNRASSSMKAAALAGSCTDQLGSSSWSVGTGGRARQGCGCVPHRPPAGSTAESNPAQSRIQAPYTSATSVYA